MKKYICFLTSLVVMALVMALVVSPSNRVSAQNWAKGAFGPLYSKTLSVTGASTLAGAVTASNTSNAIKIGSSSDLSTPPAIGGTTPAAGSFTTLLSSSLATLQGGIAGKSANNYELPVNASIAFTPYGSTETITEGATIFPYRAFVSLTAAGAVSTSATTAIADGWNDGQILTVINSGANAITVKNTANTILGADVVLGKYDTLSCWWDGDNWIRYANADN